MNTRTVSAYLKDAASKEPDAQKRRLLELAAKVPTRSDMQGFTPAEADEIVQDAFRRFFEAPQRGNRKPLYAPPTSNKQAWLDANNITHDPIAESFFRRLREAQRQVERRQQAERGTVNMSGEEMERLEVSRVRASVTRPAFSSGSDDRRDRARIDTEIDHMLRRGSSGKLCCKSSCWQCAYHRGLSPTYADLRLPLRTDRELAEIELRVRWEKAWIAFQRSPASSPLEELSFYFPILRSDGTAIRDGYPLPDDRLVGPGAYAPVDG